MNHIREVVEAKGIKYSFIAHKLGLTRGTLVWKIDNDRFTPDQRMVTAEALGVPVEALFPDVNIEGVVA